MTAFRHATLDDQVRVKRLSGITLSLVELDVLQAVAFGASLPSEICERTGYPPRVVRRTLDSLLAVKP